MEAPIPGKCILFTVHGRDQYSGIISLVPGLLLKVIDKIFNIQEMI